MFFAYKFSTKRKIGYAFSSLFLIGIGVPLGHGTIIFYVLLTIYFIKIIRTEENQLRSYFLLSPTLIWIMIFIYNRFYLYPLNGGSFEVKGVIKEGIASFFKSNEVFLGQDSNPITNLFTGLVLFSIVGVLLYLSLIHI